MLVSLYPKAGAPAIIDRDEIDRARMQELSAEGRWKFLSLANAFEPRLPVQYLIAGIFSESSLNVIYGAPGTLKTMLALDAMMHVASGKPWLPPLPNTSGQPFAVKQSPVMLVDFDSGLRRSHERIEALARGCGLTPDSEVPFHYVSFPTPWLSAKDRDSVAALAREIKERGVKLVVIDNLGTVSGDVDENSAEMVAVMGNFRWLAEETGAAIVVIHHERKSNGMDAKGSKAHEGLRGHSSINAALDLALLVERESGSRMITIRSTKTRDVNVKPFGAEFTYSHRDGTSDLETAGFFGTSGLADDRSDSSVERAILNAVQDRPLNQGELIVAVKKQDSDAGTNRIRQLADSLVSRGLLVSTDGKHGAKVFQMR
jgi:hypothetical protein